MKLILRIVPIFLLIFLLAACGGGTESGSEPAQDASSSEDQPAGDSGGEMEAEGHEEGAEEPESSGEAVEQEPDSEEEMSESSHEGDTDEGEGHDEDGESAGEEGEGHDSDETPTDEVLNEEAEDGEEMSEESNDSDMMASGDGWGESGSGAQSACDHPYMPLREGATWTYDTGEGNYSWEVTSVEGDNDAATAVILMTIGETTLEYSWDCAEGQGISSFDFAGQGMAATLPEMSVELNNGEGQFLPPADDMVPGYTWDSKLDQTMTFSIGEGEEKVEATGDIITEQTSSILSADPITAAGVTVDGVQIEQISDINIVMDMMGTSVEQAQTLNNSFEMGWGVGIMRQSTESEFGPAAVELVSFFVP